MKGMKGSRGMKSMAMKPAGPMEAEAARYPSVRIEEKTMPGLKGKTVGDKVMLKMEACVKGVSKYGNGDTEYSLDIEKGMMMEMGE